ncbi:MAG: sulfate adenylyltransferase subunit 1 (EFTu-like GTPase family), partial [Rickettsiales bacterium]
MENKIIKFLTAGSVDDGKSTLIGRLLFDTKSIPVDQIEEIRKLSGGKIDYSLFVEGLESERRQKITIDVAYRYFS